MTDDPFTDEVAWKRIRQMFLGIVDTLERWGEVRGWFRGPRTSELRKERKENRG
jgi:hypothetical protein